MNIYPVLINEALIKNFLFLNTVLFVTDNAGSVTEGDYRS